MENNNFKNSDATPIISLKTQYWLFLKQKSNVVLLALFLLAGFYALYQGFFKKNKQITTIAAFKEDKINALDKMVSGFDADTTKPEGKMAYNKVQSTQASNFYIVLPAYKVPMSTAIFTIGQADVFPYYYTIKVESFFMQLFKQGEIANPLRSLAGHFDTSFWLIFLLPLLIIVLTFNALSTELDNGNWRLINSQGISAKQWLGSKFLLVGLLIEILVSIIFLLGIFINYFHFHQNPTLNDFLFFVGSNLYLCFWLSVLYFINTLGKNTSTNALASGILWTVVCIIMPTLFTMLVEKTVQVDNTTVSRMSRRPQGSKFENDAFGIKTIKQLGKSYPQYKNATLKPTDKTFSLAVYLAYHELMDDTNKVIVQQYFDKIETRQKLTDLSCIINPAASVDGIFTGLAANDAVANHQFVWQTKAFHAQLHNAYYPALFSNQSLTKKDYQNFSVFESQNATKFSFILLLNFLFLMALVGGFYVLGNRKLASLVG